MIMNINLDYKFSLCYCIRYENRLRLKSNLVLQSRRTLFCGRDVLEQESIHFLFFFVVFVFFFLLHSNWVMLVFVSLHKLTFRSIVLLLACLSSVRCRTKQCNYMLSLSCYGYHHYRSDRCIDSFSQK